MADINFIPRETARPVLAGGSVRESVLVDIDAWPDIAARLALQERLLAGTCPYGAGEDGWKVDEKDEALLILISHERFGGEHALLRHQAVKALAKVDGKAARERLAEIARDPAEHDGVRLAALAGLAPLDRAMVDRLAEDISPLIRDLAARLRGDAKCERHRVPRRTPADHEGMVSCVKPR
jgi:hypothetical protein